MIKIKRYRDWWDIRPDSATIQTGIHRDQAY
jgi:hypothetical protein